MNLFVNPLQSFLSKVEDDWLGVWKELLLGQAVKPAHSASSLKAVIDKVDKIISSEFPQLVPAPEVRRHLSEVRFACRLC